MQPIKVLHLIPTLSSGGAERQLVNLVGSTSKEKIEHAVCVIGDAEFFAPDILKAGSRVIKLDIFAKRPFFQTASKFRRVIEKEKPDIIHTWLYDANVSARLAVFPYRQIPIVTSLQLADYEPEAARIGNWNPTKVRGLKAIDKFTARLAKPYFVACSDFVKHSYRRHFGIDERKTEVIYNSVDPDLLAASPGEISEARRGLSLPEDAFIFLNVGRLDPQKNHKILFEAFREVAAEAPNAFLLLAGVGLMEDELKKLAGDLKIDKKVLFLGRRDDIGALLELADVFVFPSFFEGLGVALVEAMFKSLPCITSRIDVFTEVIADRETGLLIDPASPNELKNAMLELYKNEELRKSLGEKALETAKRKFRADKTALEWEEFYRKVLRGSGK
jgi:glycosyltransferase involved in cell wall biosynthesis